MSPLVLILVGIGMWCLIEGAIYAIAPDFMRRMTRIISEMESREIMQAGLMSAVFGGLLLYLAFRMVG